MIQRSLFLLFNLITLCSCSTISFELPAGRFQSPESQGSLLGGKVDVRLQGATKVIIIPDSTNNADDVIGQSNTQSVGFGLDLGLWKRLDLTVSNPHDSPTRFGLKYQILGPNRREQGRGLSIALAAGYGEKEETEQNYNIFSSSSATFNLYTISVTDYALIFGYRISPGVIFYGGPSFSDYSIESTSSTRALNHSSDVSEFHLGVMATYDKNLSLALESGVQRSKWDTGAETTHGYISVSLSFNWDAGNTLEF